MRPTIIILFCLFIANAAIAQTDKIAAIRKTVETINNTHNYKIKNLDNDYFAGKDEDSDNGQELKAYYKNGQLKKMVYSLGLSNCMKTFEYYFGNDGLVFVFEKEADYPETKNGLNYNKLVPAFEGRFYIEKGKIIQPKLKGRTRGGQDDSVQIINMLKDLLDDLNAVRNR